MNWSPLLTGERRHIIDPRVIRKGPGQEIRVQQVTYEEHQFVELRIWNKTHTGWKPTDELIRIPIDELDEKMVEVRELFKQFLPIKERMDSLVESAQIEMGALTQIMLTAQNELIKRR